MRSADRHKNNPYNLLYIINPSFNKSKMNIHFISFLKINMMNMVRDPVDRAISTYYYKRRKNAGRWKGMTKEELPSKEWFEKDFNECVKSGDMECQVKV